MSLVALLAVSAVAQDHAPGARIDDAAAVQLTADGLEAAGGLLPALVPADPIDVDPTGDSGGYSCLNYEYSLSGAWVGMQVTNAQLVPGNGVLDVRIDLDVWLNDATDKFDLYYELFCAGETCPGYVAPFPVTVTAPITLTVVDDGAGGTRLDATIGEPVIDNGLEGSHIKLDCTLGTIEEVLNYFGLSIFDLIIGVAEDQLLSSLEDQMDDLEQTVEEALAAAKYDDVLAIGDAEVALQLYPQDAIITPAGLDLVMWGSAEAVPPAECIAAYDPGASMGTPSTRPVVADLAGGSHGGMLVSDDFVNSVLYGVWQAGLLCYQLTEGDESIPIPVNTSLLSLLGGEAFDELYPETKPLIIETDPRTVPVARYDAGHDVVVHVEQLGVDFIAETDYRMANALGMDLTVDAGIDLGFDGSTGELAIEVALGEGAIEARAARNELIPDATEDIENNFAGVLDSVLDAVLGSALEGLAFTLPSMEGVGLADLDAGATGSESDWLLVEAELGAVEYGDGSGCGEDGGCSGGGGGCSDGGSTCVIGGPAWTWWFVGVPALLWVRRRRNQG